MLGDGYGLIGSTSYQDLLRRARAGYGDVYQPSRLQAPKLDRLANPEVTDPSVPDDYRDKPWSQLTGREQMSLIANVISKALIVRGSDRPGAAAVAFLQEAEQAKAARKQNREEKALRQQARKDEVDQFNARQSEDEKRIALDLAAQEQARSDEFDKEGRQIVQRNVERAADNKEWEDRFAKQEASAIARDEKNFSQQRQLQIDAEARQRTHEAQQWYMRDGGLNPEDAARLADAETRGLPLTPEMQAKKDLAAKLASTINEVERHTAIAQYMATMSRVTKEVGRDLTGKPVEIPYTAQEALAALGPQAQALYGAPPDKPAPTDEEIARKNVAFILQSDPKAGKNDVIARWLATNPEDAQTNMPLMERAYDETQLELQAAARLMNDAEQATDPAQVIQTMQLVAQGAFSDETKLGMLPKLQSRYQQLLAQIEQQRQAEEYAKKRPYAGTSAH